ncbi:hypothetical protein SARC_12018 [Sphaeroforma arctica JP610]|uniref:Glycine--tRNA ligase n=1 Tax=Sphaeroforma arctica JP610 TaxID=667725 RepID=A0A0L0FFA1_9EUKA|nr:hypothetical protein SARC_12018 [Sphaeroforma arctica JP610]KNC75457.1 hypothetical protein SARC_12018 [Sphaeroforma arctica JP610]|eukprot:XP_014149359.1 hypothetical protein SARC_12018 [Sphaeroforma arctica JP610]
MNVQSNVKSLFSKRGFLFYNSIYGPNPGFTDYGPNGCAMARNLTNIWWRTIVQQNQNVTGYEGSTFIGRDVMRAWPEHRRVLSTTQGVVDTTDVAIETVLSKKDLPDDKLRELLKDKLSILHLRPSAIHSVLGNFHSIISAASPKLPFGVAQTGTCFVPGRVDSEQSEQKTNTTHSPAASEETHLDLTIFLPGHSREASVAWTNAFADSRLCWWQSLLINTPSRVTLNKTEKATTVTYESPSTGERLVLETVELLDDNVLEAHRQALKGKAKFMILNQKGIALEKPHVLHTHSSIAHCVNALALDALGDRADEGTCCLTYTCC